MITIARWILNWLYTNAVAKVYRAGSRSAGYSAARTSPNSPTSTSSSTSVLVHGFSCSATSDVLTFQNRFENAGTDAEAIARLKS